MLLALSLVHPAFACGGMFCDTANPVDQAAERIVFGFEPDGDGSGMGTITTEVQITFTGESDDFAWVVPVPGVPELFTSNDAIFQVLANATIPTYTLVTDTFGTCELGGIDTNLSMNDSASAPAEDGGTRGGVEVLAEQTVGPYDTVILQATNSDVLVGWLQDAGYGVPGDIERVVTPYVAAEQYFVALKLSADRSTGDLAPLGMRYRGTAASIPIQLTSVAAVPDLPIEAFVFGPSRAVPDNYMHVRINEAAIDWYAGGTNYRDVVRRAADEATGQAFATDYSGSTRMFAGMLWSDGRVNADSLRTRTDAVAWLEEIVFSGLQPSSQLTALLTRFVPPPDGMDATTFLSCPSCYATGADYPEFDPVVATDALQVEILDVLADAQAFIDAAPHMTRLFTTMDASEMTVDPVFVFNADVEQTLGLAHTATNEIHCGLFEGDHAERTLVLADGRRIDLPSSAWFENNETTELAHMEELTSPAAIVIEDLGATGQGTIVFDYREEAAKEAAAFGGAMAGCGCAAAPDAETSLGLGALGLAGLALRRRRA